MSLGNIPIDPQLIGPSFPETSHESQGVLSAPVPPVNASMTGSTMFQVQELPPLIPATDPQTHSAMPPLLDAGAATKSAKLLPVTASLATEEAPAPKRCGWPKGSKNKPKVLSMS
ncbi:hypothetical protein FRC06_009406 [Ceratobasidium sp. 370]|nr:hypothetical protein FRC06_009406 [Ceratobasidium sp. 370]